jgi:hypothetical protein
LAKRWNKKGFKLAFHVGREALCHVLFQIFYFGVYGGMHGGIDDGNIGIDFL